MWFRHMISCRPVTPRYSIDSTVSSSGITLRRGANQLSLIHGSQAPGSNSRVQVAPTPNNIPTLSNDEVTGAIEEPTVVDLKDTSMGAAIEWSGAALIVLFVITSTLLGCLVYCFIWLSRLCLARRDGRIQVTDDIDGREPLSEQRRIAK